MSLYMLHYFLYDGAGIMHTMIRPCLSEFSRPAYEELNAYIWAKSAGKTIGKDFRAKRTERMRQKRNLCRYL